MPGRVCLSLIYKHQAEYYKVLQTSTDSADSSPFISFMLRMFLEAVKGPTPEVTPEATPEVRLLAACRGEMTRGQLKNALGLKDDEHFRKAYLRPALEAGRIEMTAPDKPTSSRQKYRLTAKGRIILAKAGLLERRP